MRKGLSAALVCVFFFVSASSEPRDDSRGAEVLKTMINRPTADSWTVYGAVSGVHEDLTVQAGKAIRITVAKKGNTMFLAAYRKANGARGVVSEVGAHTAASPWAAIATASTNLPTNQWRVVYASGVASADYSEASVNAGLQLGQAQQTIDIGPIVILNLGQDVAVDTLPK